MPHNQEKYQFYTQNTIFNVQLVVIECFYILLKEKNSFKKISNRIFVE